MHSIAGILRSVLIKIALLLSLVPPVTRDVHQNSVAHSPFGDAKKDAWFTICCSMRLYTVLLRLNCFADYANCIISASSSFNSSSDKDGTQSAISSSDILPFIINFFAVSLALSCTASCRSLLINDFIICSSSNKLIIIVTTSFSLCAKYSLKTFLSLQIRIVSVTAFCIIPCCVVCSLKTLQKMMY